MMEEVVAMTDKLSELIRNMQKCLRCTICLHTISNAMRTRCGHRFCQDCIQKVLQNKKPTCPLCNSAIKRRDTRKDEHIEIFIGRLEKVIKAIEKDSGIDVLYYMSRRCSTQEAGSSKDSEKQGSKEDNDPSCSYTRPKQLKKTSSSKAKRTAQKSKSRVKKDDASETRNKTKYFPKCDVSGVEPLPRYEKNYPIDSSAELKVHSWLETLPNNMEFYEPRRSKTKECGLNDTLHCKMSTAVKKEVETVDPESECPEAVRENGSKRDATLGRSSEDRKDKDNRESIIEAAKSRRASSTSAPRADDTAGRMETSRVDQRQSVSTNDKSANDGEAVQEQNEDRRSDVQKTSPCDLLPSAKKNWKSVVQFGKEMRSKKRKIRSLDFSIKSKNKSKKSANESPKQKRRPGRPKGRKSVEEPSVADNDTNEKLPVHKDAEERQPRDKNNGSMVDATQPPGGSSSIVLEEGEQVHGRNLNKHRASKIIGVEQQDPATENLSQDSEKRFMRNLGLHRTPPREQIETSASDATPLKDPSEGSPILLEGYVSPWRGMETAVPNVPQPPDNFQSSTPLVSRLSLKRRDADSKLDDSAAADFNPRLLAVKRDLNHDISRTERVVAVPTKPAKTPGEPEGNYRTVNVADPGTRKGKGPKKFLTIFKKLGKLVKYRRKPVKFLYLGRTRPRLSDRVESSQESSNPTEKLGSTQKLAPENSFGNHSEVTVNTVLLPQDSTEADAEALKREATRLADFGSHSLKSVGIPAATKIAPESMDLFSKDVISASQPHDSNDILFVSIYENEGNDVRPVRQGGPAFNSNVKMLLPKDDSQLKFASLDSTARNTQPAAKPEQQGDEDTGAKRSNLSDTRGVRSRVLVRTSMQSSEESEIDDASRKKRKTSANRNNLIQRTLSTTEDDDREVGATYTKESAAYGKDDDMKSSRCHPVGHSARCTEIVSLSSDSDTNNRACAPKEQKKHYKRIVPPDIESSSSSRRSNLPSQNQRPGISATAKRKRSISPDSDSYKDLNMIVDSWSKDSKPMNKFSRLGNVKKHDPAIPANINEQCAIAKFSPLSSSSSSSSIIKRTVSSQRKRLFASDIPTDFDKLKATLERDCDDDSSDFEAIINNNRNIQRAAATVVTGEQPKRQGNEEVACLMQDNFDEIIANVDTEQLIGDYRRPSKRKCDAGVGFARNEDWRFKDASVSRLQRGSDKENEYKKAGRLFDSESDDDTTLVTEHVNADKSSRIRDDRLRERAKPVKSTSQQPTTRNTVANRLSTINATSPGSEEAANDVTPNTCFEQDSLMNITQHQMFIEQFEDDLFGKATRVQRAMKLHGQQCTPQKQKSSASASHPDLKRQDAEHSAEEDDIVENTPNAKTKNMQSNGSSMKNFLTKTPMMQMDRIDRSLSSGLGRNATPLSKRSMPNIQGQAKGAANTVARQLILGSGNEPMNRPANEVAGFNGQSHDRERFCFICSGLTPMEIEQVKRLAGLTNASYLNQFTLRVTHVIVKADKNNSSSKTLKYLQGVAHRKWVVSYQWVIDSLKEKKLINEEKYEVVDGATLETGPRNSRLRQKELFEGFAFLCIGPYEDISVEQYEELLRATGGTVVHTQEALVVERTNMKIIVIQEDMYEYEVIRWHKKTRAVPIVHDWILECISQYKLIPFYPYLQELLPQDVLALGYPEFLLEDPDDEDYESAEDMPS